jgi:endonuclease/exonuclease/phosphatase family metal-dependent hydrolase
MFVWKRFSNEWEIVNLNLPTPSPQQYGDPSSLKVGHLNVLVNVKGIIGSLMKTPTRYEYISNELIKSKDSLDVMCFNESNPLFDDFLMRRLQSAKVSGEINYIINTTNQEIQKNKDVFYIYNSMLVFRPVLEVHSLQLFGQKTRALLVLVEAPGGTPFLICAAHLAAYEEQFKKRETQLAKLFSDINSIAHKSSEAFKQAFGKKRLLIIGDFNYHLPIENRVLSQLNFIDIWREVKGSTVTNGYQLEHQGVTWDGSNAWWLPFDNRKMRLDRAVVPKGIQGYKPSKIEITFKPRIPGQSVLWGLWSLFPSDHYGLMVQLDPVEETPEGFQGREFKLSKEEEKNLMNPGGRTIKQIILIRIIFVLTVLSLLVILAFTLFK